MKVRVRAKNGKPNISIAETRNDVHAGEIETSTALATRPHLVDETRLERSVPEFSSRYVEFSSASSVEWYEHTARISDSGVLGDPTQASREKGERMWELMIGHLVRWGCGGHGLPSSCCRQRCRGRKCIVCFAGR